MKNITKKVTSISEVLSDSAGIQIKRYGSLGYQSYVSIRGSNVNQVAVYIDGVPLNDTVFGEVNLEDISIDNVSRIEIYRGFTPMRFGTSGIGGVINIVTKKGNKKKDYAKNKIELSYGSFNTTKAIFSRSQRIKQFFYSAYFNRTSSDGDFRFKNDNGTPVYNTSDDRFEKRKNNDHISYAGNIKTGYTFSSMEMLFSNDIFYKDHGTPGLNNNNSTHARFTTFRNTSNLSLKVPQLFSKYVQSQIKLFHNVRMDTFKDPRNEIGLGNKEQLGNFMAFGGNILTEINIPSCLQTISLLIAPQVELYQQKSEDYSQNNYTSPKQQRKRLNLGIEDEISIFKDTVLLVPNIRFDLWEDDFYIEKSPYLSQDQVHDKNIHSKISYKIGMKYYVYKKKKQYITLKTNYAHTYRTPTFTELFGDRGSILGNPELKNEESDNLDAGVTLNLKDIGFIKKINFSYSFFHNTIKDIIIFIHNSQNTIIAHNISKAVITGHEFAMNLNLFKQLFFQANYTVQFPKDKSHIPYYNGNYLPHRPVHEFFASLKYRAKYFSLTYEFVYTGANFRDRTNSEFYFLEHRIYHNVMVEIYPVKEILVTLEVKNIADNLTRDKIGYPLPGRSYYGTVAYSF